MPNNKRILDAINKPTDLHNLDVNELKILCSEIREEIVSTTSTVGGHVSSSLGAVEIIVAVHSLINCPKDKFIFDVGHQAYAHKLLTGRNKSFKSLRQLDGLSGFTRPSESEYDIHYSGHASDALSFAIGLAKATNLKYTDENIVVLIGDASIAGGMAFEAINQISQEKLPITIILNDNRMSISESVGGFGEHLQSVRLHHRYKDAANAIRFALKRMGAFGDIAIRAAHASKESLKHFLMPDFMIFEELGIPCLPTVDGHNMTKLRNTIEKAINFDGPVLVHATTIKGAGYKPAEENPEMFHGIGPYDIKTGKAIAEKSYTYTNAFSEQLMKLADSDNRIVALTAAMSSGTGLKPFQKKFKNRFIDVGIAEEHLVGLAAGLAKSGRIPFVAVYSAFLQRAIDQMITNVGIDKLNVKFCIDRAGLVGPDGVSHHGMMDMNYAKMIPGFTVIAPSCAHELKRAVLTAYENFGPYAIRYPRGKAPEIDNDGNILDEISDAKVKSFEVGKSRELKDGNDLTIMAFGSCVKDALYAHKELSDKGYSVRCLDMRFVKPLDEQAIIKSAMETGKILVVEDGIKNGGAASAILDFLSANDLTRKVQFRSLAIDDQFVQHGTIDELKKAANIDTKSIVAASIKILN